jgi:hypothetical protein
MPLFGVGFKLQTDDKSNKLAKTKIKKREMVE